MNRAQKKPVIVDFIQLKENNIYEVYTEVFSEPNTSSSWAQEKWNDFEAIVKKDGLSLKTPESGEGTQIASIGDYLVFGVSEKLGRHCWPVKPDYFEGAYDVLP
jgi:hypothetical protein